MARRSHPFPYRTRKLSFSAPMVVGACAPVRVGRCQAVYGGLAQLGEHLPFNQRVEGSSPSWLTILNEYAGVAELADAPDLGSGAARRGGSTPFTRTI